MKETRFIEIFFFLTIISYLCYSCNKELETSLYLKSKIDSTREEIHDTKVLVESLSKDIMELSIYNINYEKVEKVRCLLYEEYETGNREEFIESMKEDSFRKNVFNAMRKNYDLDIDSFEEFSHTLGYKSFEEIKIHLLQSLDDINGKINSIEDICYYTDD